MTYTGMFLRQYMGQQSYMIPNTSDSWLYSPDLLVYGCAAAYTTSNFNSSINNFESRSWYFSQPPTLGQANYVYLRGLSLSVAPQPSCIVHLYYCEAAALLQPKSWKSDTFSVTPENGGSPASINYFSLTWTIAEQRVVSDDPVNKTGNTVTWTPPDTGANPHYYLIAWIDNTNGGDPPPFSDLPDFADQAALAAYVKNMPNMTMFDTWYNGMFVRQYAGQTSGQQGNGAQTSPDLIVSDTAVADPSTFATPASYASTALNQTATLQMRNFIYVRGLNTSSAQKTSRVYLYYTTSDQPSPAGWKSDAFTVAGQPCNYVDLTAAPGAVAVAALPVVWRLDAVDPGANYVLISYTDDSDAPQPPDFSIFGYVNPQMIEQFVATQPRMNWLQINGSAPQKVPDMSYEFGLGVEAGLTYVGLQFEQIGTAGTVSISVPGSTSANTLVVNQMQVPDPNAAVMWPLNFAANFNTSMVVNFWANGAPAGGSINAVMVMANS